MKTHAILININHYNLNIHDLIIDEVINIIDYVLKPFIQLKRFSFNDYSNTPSMISGAETEVFLNKISDYINSQSEQLDFSELSFENQVISNDTLGKVQRCSGVYTFDSTILNTANNSSIITYENLLDIQNNPQDYIIAFTNVYK